MLAGFAAVFFYQFIFTASAVLGIAYEEER
jgi:hypothetical protein